MKQSVSSSETEVMRVEATGREEEEAVQTRAIVMYRRTHSPFCKSVCSLQLRL